MRITGTWVTPSGAPLVGMVTVRAVSKAQHGEDSGRRAYGSVYTDALLDGKGSVDLHVVDDPATIYIVEVRATGRGVLATHHVDGGGGDVAIAGEGSTSRGALVPVAGAPQPLAPQPLAPQPLAPQPPVAAPAAPRTVFATVTELMAEAEASSRFAQTIGGEHTQDGGGVSWMLTSTTPAPELVAKVAVPLEKGGWASPILRTMPPHHHSARLGARAVEIARTYVGKGKDVLVYDPRKTPASGGRPRAGAAPYGITCSSFTSTVMQSVPWERSGYVRDQGSAGDGTLPWVYPKETQGRVYMNQAHTQARLLYLNGLAWHQGPTLNFLYPGDILHFSKQNPEGAGTTGRYWMNIYHTALYIGGGKVIHAYGPQSPTAVMEETLSPALISDISIVARPWVGTAE